jgi:hypothetical protein
MGSFYVALYRTYFILKKSAEKDILRRWPGAGPGLKRLVQRYFLRRAQASCYSREADISISRAACDFVRV